jgi:hypothetical protein
MIEDWIDCALAHQVTLLWHCAPNATLLSGNDGSWRLAAGGRRITMAVEGADLESAIVAGSESPPQGWVSSRFYERTAAPVLVVHARLMPQQVVRTVIRREPGPPVGQEMAA